MAIVPPMRSAAVVQIRFIVYLPSFRVSWFALAAAFSGLRRRGHFARNQSAGDTEMLERALGLSAPEFVARHLNDTQAVSLFLTSVMTFPLSSEASVLD